MNQNHLDRVKQVVVNTIIARLEITYEDYIRQVKGFENIPDFFRNHIYAPANKEERDEALNNLYEKLKSIVGQDLVENINKLIILIELSDQLDYEIAKIVQTQFLEKIDVNQSIMPLEIFEQSLYLSNQYEQRKKQIELVCESLSFFFALSKIPLIKLVMAPIKIAASIVNANSLVDTMEEGYRISREIKDIKPFIIDFRQRELSYLDSILEKYKY